MEADSSDGISRSYLDILLRMHSTLKPRTYLEIGTQSGTSLRLAHCSALAIDPRFELIVNVFEHKRSCQFFQMPSDEFFLNYDAAALLGGPIDFAFLDGMHLYEFLLRDFAYVEAYCKVNSIIAIHDAIPGDLAMSDRTPVHGAAWAGDVWKVILLLKKYRPDLNILCLDAEPTGLVFVTNLNPQSSLLRERYFPLVEEYRNFSLSNLGLSSYRSDIDVQPASIIETTEQILSRFWI